MDMQVSTLSRKILRALSDNSRITLTTLSEKLGASRYMVKERLVALEKEFALHYTIEPDYAKLGFTTPHVIRIKLEKKPKSSEIKELEALFSKSRAAQFVALTEGNFDMLIFALAKTSTEYIRWETSLDLILSKYGVAARMSEVNTMHLGFIPIDSATIEASSIEPIFKTLLIALNQNSRASLRELSRKLGKSDALTNYYMQRLEKTGLIKRYTMIALKPPFNYNIAYFANYTVRSGVLGRVNRERRTMYWRKLDEFPVFNEFPIMWSTTGSYRSFTWALYDNYKEGLDHSVRAHEQIYKEDKAKIEYVIVKRVLKGAAPIRNVDQRASYALIDWDAELI